MEDPGINGRIVNIKVDLKEIRWEGMAWIYLAQGRPKLRAVVKTFMNLLSFLKCGECLY